MSQKNGESPPPPPQARNQNITRFRFPNKNNKSPFYATNTPSNITEKNLLGKADNQNGQRLTLRCGTCHRPLMVYYQQKSFTTTPKLVVLDGSVHKTPNGTLKLYVRCKCGAKTIFENKQPHPTKQGWKRINQK